MRGCLVNPFDLKGVMPAVSLTSMRGSLRCVLSAWECHLRANHIRPLAVASSVRLEGEPRGAPVFLTSYSNRQRMVSLFNYNNA